MNLPRYFALIPAAGVGARMQLGSPKQYARLAGKPMLQHVMETFAQATHIAHTYVVVSTADAYIDDLPCIAGSTVLRCGGATRRESVMNGLAAIAANVAADDWMLVHDAARPGLTVTLIEQLIAALKDDAVGGLLALPVVDTIKRANGQGRVDATVSRDALWAAQTPQMFRHATLLQALQQALAVTDEASAMEALGLQPKLVEGHARNFKVTLPQDLLLAELYLKGRYEDNTPI
jgi:2-C-methyl-D-erythritol 4-phosphate cytidylyltransferase